MYTKNLAVAFALAIIIFPLSSLVFSASASGANITLNPTTGTVGTTTLIKGEGFIGHSATIYWDEQVIVQDVPITKSGELTYNLDIPNACKGNHVIEVTDDTNWSGSAASFTFTVLPQIRVLPHIVRPGITSTVVGSGFSAFERDIKITWNGNDYPGSPSTADMLGKWSASLDIPNVTKGEHFIGAYSSVTDATEVTEVVVIIAPAAKVSPLSGTVGTEITIDGFGFRVGEDGISITYDDELIKYNITGEFDGSWRTTVNIPASTRGYHTIGIYGSSFTPKGVVPSVDFEVNPKIESHPTSGSNGTEVVVTGTGFAENEAVTINFDTVELETASTVADHTGSFSAIFEVPQSKEGDHTIAATGSEGNSAKTSFTTEQSSLIAPQLLSPKPGDKLEIFDSVGDVFLGATKYLIRVVDYMRGSEQEVSESALITFDWSEVADSTDINYILQIAHATDFDFSSPILTRTILANTEYPLSKKDALPIGNYSWRIKAVDNAGNESPWSGTWEFEMVSMSTRVFILSLIIPLLAIAVLIFGILFWRANR